MTKKGLYVSVDGMDGTGKTTLIATVNDILGENRLRNYGSLTDNKLAVEVRKLYTSTNIRIQPKTEALLLAAVHWENYHSQIAELTQSGVNLIADRSCLSALAYQGYAHAEQTGDLSNMQLLENVAGSIEADLKIIITGDPQTCLKRCMDRDGIHDRVEARSLAYHQSVNRFFTEHAISDPDSIHISNDGTEEQFYEKCLQVASKIKKMIS